MRTEGLTYLQAAERFADGEASVCRRVGMREHSGSLGPITASRTRATKVDEDHRQMFRAADEVIPAATPTDLRAAPLASKSKRPHGHGRTGR